MKPTKIENQELLSLGELMYEQSQAVQYWTQIFVRTKKTFWKKVKEIMQINPNEVLTFDYENKTISSLGEEEIDATGQTNSS